MPARSSQLNNLLSALPSKTLTQGSTASCDINGLSSLAQRYPPTGVQFSQVSRSGLTYTWSISGQKYGNGKYIAQASSVYKPGTVEEWPASGAFDHQQGASLKKSGWAVANVSGKSVNWLTLELPEPIRLDYYTISQRGECSCAKNQSPTRWELFCVDNPSQKVKLDARTGQSFDRNQCRIYPESTTTGGTRCKKFQWVGAFVSMSELSLYGVSLKTTATTPKPPVTTTSTTTTSKKTTTLKGGGVGQCM